jgi:hypothetical protein
MSVTLVWVSSVLGGLVGTIVGWLIGTYAPNYYVVVFDAAKQANFHPVQVGVGLGSSQGMLAGFLGGIAVVFILAWRDVKKAEKA